ncbi:MAG: hypothetical protein WCY74_09335 [Sphaerochaetaceae bacterium]
MKRILPLCLIILMIGTTAFAFEGFSDIFGPVEENTASVGTAAEKPGGLDLGGSLSFSIMGIRNRTDQTEIDTSVNGGLTLDLSWNGSIVDAKANLALEPKIDNVPTWIDIFTGLSITTYFPGGRLEAGLLKKEWGSGDGVHVVDVLNAPDYRKGIVDDTMAMKIAEPMIISTATWGDTSLEIVFKPMLVPMVAAQDPGDRWSMTSPTQQAYLDSASDLAPPLDPSDLATLSHSQYGGRLTSILGPADVGLIYWKGFYTQPSMRISLNPDYSLKTIDYAFTSAHLFAGEATLVAGPITLMMEGGFWLSEDTDGSDPAVANSKWVYLGGIGFMVPKTSAYVSLTWHGHYITDFNGANPLDTDTATAIQSSNGEPYMNTIIAAVELPLAREKVKVRLAGTYQVESMGYALLPSVSWNIADDLLFKAAARVFGSHSSGSESLFRTWDSNDSLTMGISYLF